MTLPRSFWNTRKFRKNADGPTPDQNRHIVAPPTLKVPIPTPNRDLVLRAHVLTLDPLAVPVLAHFQDHLHTRGLAGRKVGLTVLDPGLMDITVHDHEHLPTEDTVPALDHQ